MGNCPSDLRNSIRRRDVEFLKHLLEKTKPEKRADLINNDYAQDCIMDACSPAVGNAFYYAVRNSLDEPTIVVILLENGADVHSFGLNDETPLHRAARCNYQRVSRVLIEHGADINVTDDRGKSPLHAAAVSPFDTSPTIRYLVDEAGAKNKVNFADYNGNTPLHDAASADNLQAAQTLLEYGAEVNVKSSSGNTPLHCSKKDSEVWKLLLKHNADLNIQNNAGKLAGNL